MKTSLSDIHTYVVGIQYENPFAENSSFFEIQRKVILTELAEEVAEYLINGNPSYPAFPPESNPVVWYAMNLDDQEDGDVLDILKKEIENCSSLNTAA
ncbi:MAG: hypothetical protein ISR95_03505 [Candidatus Marinimicrobia bacterium]|nr:hypothetical protein [Candidatus Brocadiales bacterium]MBL7046681.1 hypothetical protein [Candidatus Neomarinimicrobiota bacterium]